ncbi:50S ribosomal protein L11 [Candidatus Tremblaya phenacola]|uniref:50S ribosomal protein L11 n=1 Tax=Candidatus Tremblayella phenacoccinincola TaxID=1010676 RepID=UPI0010D6EDCC|nr:50S ribosomal protein L11 [Candidatus Tremblaya phenacola]KAH0998218.1 LSU ribosomal protein L11p [Candidatus Tremblaya phenacola]
MDTKKPVCTLRLIIPAGKANPSPPVGPALGQKGVNIMEFCNTFNMLTKPIETGTLVPTIVSIQKDKSFKIRTRTSLTSSLIKKLARVETIHSVKTTYIDYTDVKTIAEIKLRDLNTLNLVKAIKTIKGTIKSMRVKVKVGTHYE